MAKTKKQKRRENIKTFLIPILRQASRIWHAKRKARDAAKIKIQIGSFKNGKPRYQVMYTCGYCGGVFEYKETQMDHKDPVIEVATGFIDWNTYIERLFAEPDGYVCACLTCHTEKTNEENKNRRKVKKNLDN